MQDRQYILLFGTIRISFTYFDFSFPFKLHKYRHCFTKKCVPFLLIRNPHTPNSTIKCFKTLMVTNGNECFLAIWTPFILSSAGRTMAVWFWREGKFISFLCASFFGERDAYYSISRHNGLPKRIDHELNYTC